MSSTGGRPQNLPPPESEMYPHAIGGNVERICATCKRTFYTFSNVRPGGGLMRYCSPACKRQAENARYYQKNRQQIIELVMKRRKKIRA